MKRLFPKSVDWLVLPLLGGALCVGAWQLAAGHKVWALKGSVAEARERVLHSGTNGAELWERARVLVEKGRVEAIRDLPDSKPVWAALESSLDERREGVIKDLPNVAETWRASRPYIVEPFAKRGEMDQGILRFTWYSLELVVKGYALALLAGIPIGFLLGVSPLFTKMWDPMIQILRPLSPLAWLPLGLVLFLGAGKHASELGALFTIAICSMWPTVLNTAVGVRAVPQDYLNVARVLKLSRSKTLFKVLLPATLPYMFTGFRLSLGIAWLVIVAAEMLTGRPGVGGFLWQEYNALIYEHIILCILTIGIVGFVLDRLMSVVERRFKTV